MRLDPTVIQQQIANLLTECPELAEDEILRSDMIEGETEAFDLLTAIVRKIEDAKALSEGTKERLEELRARKDRFGRRVDGLRSLAIKIMDAGGLTKAELAEATLSLRASGRKLVGEPDPASLPDDLCKITRAADKTKIKAALEAGQSVPGCELGNGEPSLAIRIK